jgi:Right handed beta helix region
VSITVSRTSCSPEDRLDVTELIAALKAERDGVPWPPTSHRLLPEPAVDDPTRPTSHRLRSEPAEDGPGRRRVVRRLAPVLVGLVVLAVLAATAVLRPASRPEPVDAALTGAAPSTSAEPAPTSTTVPSPAVVAPSTATSAPAPAATTSKARPAPTKTSSSASRARAATGTVAPAGGSGAPGVRPVRPACRGNADAPKAGDVICFTGNLDAPLKISTGGTDGAPIVYSGNGSTRVPGITAEADNVVIQGFVSDGADSTGIYASGRNVTIQDNTVTNVKHTDDDLDAIRFFGDGAKVLHNFVHDLEGTSDIGGSHVDCMQNYATSRPGSSHVTIQGNRCEGIRAQCLMAEGPNADTASGKGGGGEGESRDWLFDGNFCDAHAEAQSVAIQDIQNVTITNNTMAGQGHKAFALGQNSTGAVVKGNKIGDGYGREVGFDDESVSKGYQGPAPE